LTEDIPEKLALRRDKLRDALIAAAEDAVTTRGLSGLKARDLAAAAGCALGAIYNVFDDLDELVLRVNQRTLAMLERALNAGEAAADPAQELLRLARAYLAFARREEKRWRALFEHRLPPARDPPGWYVVDLDRLFGRLEAPLAHLLPKAEPAARAQLARTLFSAVHGVVTLGMEEKLAPTPAATLNAQLDGFVGMIAAGLAPRKT